jgi:hypothetical protein
MLIRPRSAFGALTLIGLLCTTGCGLLDTTQPDIVQPNQLNSPQGAEARRNGALHDFVIAKDGDGSQFGTEGMLLLTGDMADEFGHSGFIPSTVEFDQRLIATNNGSLEDIFFRLHKARAGTEAAASALQQYADDPTTNSGIPEMLSLAGFTYIFFAEDFCSGVPYSSITNGVVSPGGADSTVGSLRLAIARFDSALASPAIGIDPDVQYLAQVGKARALLNLGIYDSAAIAVQGVPTAFAYQTEHDASPLYLANAIFIYGISGISGGSITMADSEGGVGLPFRTASDPRTPFLDTGHLGLDQTTPQFDILKYPDIGASVTLADGIEARLIEAEAALQASNIPGMSAILDLLRSGIGLGNLPTPATPAEARDQLFSERAFWMYATGHRLGDLRRLVKQYGLPVNAVFPSGSYLRGGSYGTRVSFPVPASEDQNRNFDRTRCDPDLP